MVLLKVEILYIKVKYIFNGKEFIVLISVYQWVGEIEFYDCDKQVVYWLLVILEFVGEGSMFFCLSDYFYYKV